MQFSKGDIVQVDYKSIRLIEEWMNGLRAVGPGDVGVVKFNPSTDWVTNEPAMVITVVFPLIGTYGISSRDLKLLQKVGSDDTIQAG